MQKPENFIAGQALKSPEWSISEHWLRNFGRYYPTWVSRAFKTKTLDLEEPAYYNNKTECLIFNKKRYPSWSKLDSAYPRGFNYDSINKGHT